MLEVFLIGGNLTELCLCITAHTEGPAWFVMMTEKNTTTLGATLKTDLTTKDMKWS